jgi:Tfp pilus assembly protein PilF
MGMSDTAADRDVVLETFWERSREAMERGDEEQARAWLEGIVELDGDDVEGWLALARVTPDPRERMQCYSQILQLSPGNDEAKKGLRQARRQL